MRESGNDGGSLGKVKEEAYYFSAEVPTTWSTKSWCLEHTRPHQLYGGSLCLTTLPEGENESKKA